MKFIFFSILFVFGFQTHSKPPPDKILHCTERGCNCKGKGCSFVDKRIIKNGSTVAISCTSNKGCDKKIVYALKDKYGCQSSVQKLQEQDYLVVSECLIIDAANADICPPGTTSVVIEELIKICLEVPGKS